MTEAQIAVALQSVNGIERTVGRLLASGDDEERKAVMLVWRQAGGLRSALERWIVARASRAAHRDVEELSHARDGQGAVDG